MRLLLATSNPGKLSEVQAALAGLPLEFATLSDCPDLPLARETADTFLENARLKARHYTRCSGLPALADDSGLTVDALQGAPGVRSARFAPSDAERISKLLRLLESASDFSRRARFVCALSLWLPEGHVEAVAEVEGEILTEPRGRGGFGYDPVFFYPPLGKSFAELTTRQKNEVSHRGRALRVLRERLEDLDLGQ